MFSIVLKMSSRSAFGLTILPPFVGMPLIGARRLHKHTQNVMIPAPELGRRRCQLYVRPGHLSREYRSLPRALDKLVVQAGKVVELAAMQNMASSRRGTSIMRAGTESVLRALLSPDANNYK